MADPLAFSWDHVHIYCSDLEASARPDDEHRSQAVKRRVDVDAFTTSFLEVLSSAAERYSHPNLYVSRKFPTGDRLTTSVLAKLNFADLYGSATLENGTRHPALGTKPGAARTSQTGRSRTQRIAGQSGCQRWRSTPAWSRLRLPGERPYQTLPAEVAAQWPALYQSKRSRPRKTSAAAISSQPMTRKTVNPVPRSRYSCVH